MFCLYLQCRADVATLPLQCFASICNVVPMSRHWYDFADVERQCRSDVMEMSRHWNCDVPALTALI